MIGDEQVEKMLHAYRDMAKQYAQAKADATYLDHFRKSKLAILQKDAMKAGHESVAAQDREAHAHPEYHELLRGLSEAVRIEAELRYRLEGIRARIDLYRTQKADSRAERKGYSL